MGRKRRVGPANSSDVATPPDGEGGAARGVVSMENHSDKQWTSTMLETLTRCGEGLCINCYNIRNSSSHTLGMDEVNSHAILVLPAAESALKGNLGAETPETFPPS